MSVRKTSPVALMLTVAAAMALAAPAIVHADTIPAAQTRAANYLTAQQLGSGLWTEQPTGYNFNGTMAAGLAHAYFTTGNATWQNSAQLAGSGIITSVGAGNYFGDEAFALTEIAKWQPNPVSNTYYNAVNSWMTGLSSYSNGIYSGTAGFLNHLETVDYGGEISQPLIYTAYYTRAAYALNVPDKAVYRNKLLDLLGKIDDSAAFPVGALGAGVWGLGGSGGFTTGTTSAGGGAFANTAANLLPGILASMQHTNPLDPTSPATAPLGSFWYDFGSTNAAGFTEDTAFGIMGLEAALMSDPGTYAYQAEILSGQTALIGAIADPSGVTNEYTDASGANNYYVFAGRALEAIPEPASLGLLGLGVAGMMIRRRRCV